MGSSCPGGKYQDTEINHCCVSVRDETELFEATTLCNAVSNG